MHQAYDAHKDHYSFEELPINDPETFKQNVCAVLVNTEMNKDILEEIPHREFLDLSVIYKFVILKDGELGTATVTKILMEKMGLTEESLHFHAMENTFRIMPVEVISMYEMMKEMIEGEVPEFLLDEALKGLEANNNKMFIVTNKYRLYGATAMLNDDVLSDLAEEYGDLIVFPSSTDEIICVPTGDFDDEEEDMLHQASQMVKEVNQAELPSEKILSDHAYIYRKGAGVSACI